MQRFGRSLLFFLFCFCSNFLLAQEICDNGKDDDNDGWIDLQDPDCSCNWTASDNLLLNPSFEQFKHCLTASALYPENYDILNDWVHGGNRMVTSLFTLSCPMDSLWAYRTMYHVPFRMEMGFL